MPRRFSFSRLLLLLLLLTMMTRAQLQQHGDKALCFAAHMRTGVYTSITQVPKAWLVMGINGSLSHHGMRSSKLQAQLDGTGEGKSVHMAK